MQGDEVLRVAKWERVTNTADEAARQGQHRGHGAMAFGDRRERQRSATYCLAWARHPAGLKAPKGEQTNGPLGLSDVPLTRAVCRHAVAEGVPLTRAECAGKERRRVSLSKAHRVCRHGAAEGVPLKSAQNAQAQSGGGCPSHKRIRVQAWSSGGCPSHKRIRVQAWSSGG